MGGESGEGERRRWIENCLKTIVHLAQLVVSWI